MIRDAPNIPSDLLSGLISAVPGETFFLFNSSIEALGKVYKLLNFRTKSERKDNTVLYTVIDDSKSVH
jgi:hypothetical protein